MECSDILFIKNISEHCLIGLITVEMNDLAAKQQGIRIRMNKTTYLFRHLNSVFSRRLTRKKNNCGN